jgi:Lon protease-like protein
MNDDQALQNFDGITRLFPLPNMVLFPQVVQPLHIFEMRYRQLMADTLASDRLMSIVLLRPGWENDYEQNPQISSIACIGRVVADQMLPDGRYNFLLRGLGRVRIVEELPTDKLYRTAKVELLDDYCDAPLMTMMSLRKDLEETIIERFHPGQLQDQLRELFRSELMLGALTDILAFALPIDVETKQSILEEMDVEVRARLLLNGFGSIPQAPKKLVEKFRKFPPDFSIN